MDDASKRKTPRASKKAMKEGKFMQPVSKQTQREKGEQNYEDQVPKKGRRSDRGSYIAFRMHVQNGVISVTGCKRVNSELAQFEDIVTGGLTYEVVLDARRLSLSSIPDFGEQRSFPRPAGEKGQPGHHITIIPGFDFSVRIPGDNITEKDLPRLKITLYRFKEHLPSLKLTEATLSSQFEKEARPVAQLDGIKVGALPQDVKSAIKRSFAK